MISMFGAGIAMGAPKLPVWVFMGDGAFVMNPGMLMVERDLNLPNLKHFLVSNRVYNATGAVPLANAKRNDYAGIARPWASNASLRSTPSRDYIASSTKSFGARAHLHGSRSRAPARETRRRAYR